eukprot:4207775-Pyramimonas_sp.AAC.1
MAPELKEEAMGFDWAQHRDYMKGIHTPVRFILWNFNGIVDGHGDLIGIGSGTQTRGPGCLRWKSPNTGRKRD